MPVSDTDLRLRRESSVIGFDVRLTSEDGLPAPPTWRREAYAIRADAGDIMSVDAAVLPSAFGDGLTEEVCARFGLPRLGWQEWRGGNAGLWDDLSAMLEACKRIGRTPRLVIAVTWERRVAGVPSNARNAPITGQASPAALDRSWVLEGFDVADCNLISGLLNCGYLPGEFDDAVRRWSTRLLKNHLFAKFDEAERFAAECDARVAEHAPFLVYGVYRHQGAANSTPSR